MFSNFKKLCLLFLFGTNISLYAQQTSTSAINENWERPLGMFKVGAYWANPIGNSFVKDGLDLNTGFSVDLHTYITSNIIVGAHYNFMSADVKDIRVTGNYEDTNIWTLSGSLGYAFRPINNFSIVVLAGAGSAVYKNQRANNKFTDRGLSLWIAPEIAYSFTQSIALYITSGYRYDHMNIDVPEALENSFNNLNYLSLSTGLRFTF